MQFSRVRRKSLSDCLSTVRLLLFSVVLIHRLAMSCGSTISTQRLAVDRMMPLSVEKSSRSSPFMYLRKGEEISFLIFYSPAIDNLTNSGLQYCCQARILVSNPAKTECLHEICKLRTLK